MGYVGPSFTWLYQRVDGFQIRERLDRALASLEWERRFQDARLYHLTCSASDHSPLSLHFFRKPQRQRRSKIFKFESIWLKDSKCEEVVKTAWFEGCIDSGGFPISWCLELCWNRLNAWNKSDFGHVGRKILELQSKLEWLEHQPASPSIICAT